MNALDSEQVDQDLAVCASETAPTLPSKQEIKVGNCGVLGVATDAHPAQADAHCQCAQTLVCSSWPIWFGSRLPTMQD
ncbi:uncharacterized protein FOMMEDRAFT_155650 [Fomitiporia mediterranea MF3/22]|uniref:uncharacterized protein n=1 Tax=Fomitiporia mediterranea (strain MF3/22) TaxID=694068 RepID=UPI0004408D37|nr:uncharacterized protein FOMMEDRAFT_155650 [Fomitiporia mediterranea MF3/22]EJD04509.1 hypothetical protein FOMMEDRAFT_155650 [Fomitiporia mediterranea MF3/22]